MAMTNAGGKRVGSGRKTKADKKQTFTMRLSPNTLEQIKELKSNGFVIGGQFEIFIDTLYNQMKEQIAE